MADINVMPRRVRKTYCYHGHLIAVVINDWNFILQLAEVSKFSAPNTPLFGALNFGAYVSALLFTSSTRKREETRVVLYHGASNDAEISEFQNNPHGMSRRIKSVK